VRLDLAVLAAGIVAVQAAGCAQFRDGAGAQDASADVVADVTGTADAADASSAMDAPSDGTGPDGATSDDAGPDASAGDAAEDADAVADGGLSPLLDVPPSGMSCDPSQGDSTCSSVGETCRISSTTSGTCDTYTPNHIAGYPCTTSEDCDDTLQCYNGTCHVLCPLGMPCSGGCTCFGVGNDAVGLCCPGQ